MCPTPLFLPVPFWKISSPALFPTFLPKKKQVKKRISLSDNFYMGFRCSVEKKWSSSYFINFSAATKKGIERSSHFNPHFAGTGQRRKQVCSIRFFLPHTKFPYYFFVEEGEDSPQFHLSSSLVNWGEGEDKAINRAKKWGKGKQALWA